MQCPCCQNTPLKAIRLDAGLPAHGCHACEGVIIPLLYYRDWVERNEATEIEQNKTLDAELVAEKDTRRALNCPKCSGIMTKYKITGCSANKLDLCDHCDEAWLDGGEWELLKALQLSRHVPAIFTDKWQQKISQEIIQQKFKERFAKVLGQSDMIKADDFRTWVNGHDKRAEILLYINSK